MEPERTGLPANGAARAEGSRPLERRRFSGVSVYVRPGTPDQVVARSCLGKEFETVTDLIATRLDEHPGMHVYHFGHYEPSAFKRLSGRHATRA